MNTYLLNMYSFIVTLLLIPFLRNIDGNPRTYKKSAKIFMVNIDNTICNTNCSDYIMSEPILENIEFFNELYERGNIIHYWTSRGMNTGKNWDVFTISQMKAWNVKYDTLNMNKPNYDYWIDDKAINIQDL